jgi:hypothetical protein
MDLNSLKLDVSDKSQEEILEEATSLFHEEFFKGDENRGSFIMQSNQTVYFFRDRFEHAFFTSSNRSRHPAAKDKLALDRVERLLWIKPVLMGLVEGTECWQVTATNDRRLQRLYIVVHDAYVIWLESRKDGAWKFSSAYCAGRSDIQRYTQGGVRIWKK